MNQSQFLAQTDDEKTTLFDDIINKQYEIYVNNSYKTNDNEIEGLRSSVAKLQMLEDELEDEE